MYEALEVAMILLACTTPVLAILIVVNFFKYRERTTKHLQQLKNEIDLASKTELKREVQELRERVQVLESIVTDGEFELQQQFRKLERGH